MPSVYTGSELYTQRIANLDKLFDASLFLGSDVIKAGKKLHHFWLLPRSEKLFDWWIT